MKRAIPILMLLSSCATVSGGGGSSPPVSQNWAGGWGGYAGQCFGGVQADGSFNFSPNIACHVDYVMHGSTFWPTSVTITVTGGPFYTYQDDSGKPGCNHGPSVKILIIGGIGGGGRFWQRQETLLTPGVHVIPIDYTPSLWSDVNGHTATALPPPSNSEIGYAFGDDCASHGVYGDGSFSQQGIPAHN